MENWSVPEGDRPYIRPARSFNPWLAVAAIGALAWALAIYFRTWSEPPPPAPPPAAVVEVPASAPAPEPAIRHPLAQGGDAPGSLPSLETSVANDRFRVSVRIPAHTIDPVPNVGDTAAARAHR